jgi:ATP-dependent exoDNAse (exonuclease V) beta subunit
LQKETDIKRLKVMSASAGSGKTYQLVLEYLEILLDYQKDSAKFKHIVAMTFTNKAAFEMKDRVIKTLFSLATHDGTNEKTAEIVTKKTRMSFIMNQE